MEYYIAIDNVCAWPKLVIQPDGTIFAAIFNQPWHARWRGDAECWASTDGGRLWRRCGQVTRSGPGEAWNHRTFGIAANGDLILLVSGWGDRPPVGQESKVGPSTRPLGPCVFRSSDGGRTWRETGTIEEAEGGHINCFGQIVRFPDGRLAAAFRQPPKDRPPFYVSDDDGHTWRFQSFIGNNGSETALLVHGEKRVLAAVRTKCDQHLQLHVSDDGGVSWRDHGNLSLARQIPAHLLELRDGRILLTYGIRDHRGHAIGLRLSPDVGETWSDPSILLNLDNPTGSVDCGYPSCVQLSDGTIVTAYYSSFAPWHNRYHMGVVRWELDEIEFVFPRAKSGTDVDRK
jgi:hypothetical protein